MCCGKLRCREAGTMEVELEMLKGSVMALVVAANTSAEGDTYRELSDSMLKVGPPPLKAYIAEVNCTVLHCTVRWNVLDHVPGHAACCLF
jgi:hypothetical protein